MGLCGGVHGLAGKGKPRVEDQQAPCLVSWSEDHWLSFIHEQGEEGLVVGPLEAFSSQGGVEYQVRFGSHTRLDHMSLPVG